MDRLGSNSICIVIDQTIMSPTMQVAAFWIQRNFAGEYLFAGVPIETFAFLNTFPQIKIIHHPAPVPPVPAP